MGAMERANRLALATNSSCTCRWTAMMEPPPLKAPPSSPSQAPCNSPGRPTSLQSPSRHHPSLSKPTLHI